MSTRIPIAGPWITQREIDTVLDAVSNGWYEGANLHQKRFEEAFANYVGRRFAIALPSCTAALHLSLASLDLKPGDEVVVPEATWIATSAPISYVGATPVFADIDARSWCLDPRSFEAAITPRTRAVMVVNLYGGMPDMDAILEIAARHGVAVIEDAAESVGSEYHGRPAGSFGLASAFSFHGTKTLTTGEGGMLLTDDEALYRRCLFLRDHGRAEGPRLFWNTEVAFKYRMSSLQAALGLAQLERVEELVERKREIFGWYRDALADVDGITLNYEAPHTRNSYWMVTAVVDASFGLAKEDLIAGLEGRGIDSRPFFYPLSSLPAYSHLVSGQAAAARNGTAYRISPYGINLPSALNSTWDQVAYVCRELRVLLVAKKTVRGPAATRMFLEPPQQKIGYDRLRHSDSGGLS